MNTKDAKIVELRASGLVQSLGLQVPIDVEKVAEEFGIKISYAPSEEYSGMLIRKEDGKVLMGINDEEPKVRMRFTIAHEIAHFIFDKKSKVSIDYRSTFQVLDKPEIEKRADLFAANLLMPKKILKLDFERISGRSLSEESLNELAKKYQVSKDAMKYRLSNLGLIELI